MLWIDSDSKDSVIKEVEERTQLVATIADGRSQAWKKSVARARVVVITLPSGADVLREVLVTAQETAGGLPVVVLDPHHLLDESLVRPPVTNFQHVTTQDIEQIAERVRAAALPCLRDRTSVGVEAALKSRLIGDSAPMCELRALIRLAAPRTSTVLITGETGTGKELVARALHALSPRSGADLVAVNCGALPENLIEAELFGHTKGAFTGAVGARIGRFEQADKSSLFLDEVGEMPFGLQVRLLRVLQEREIQRVGSSETIKVDVRLVAASNLKLAQVEVPAGRFREDLYYRLNVIPIHVPALRDRKTDIPALAEHFINRVCLREGIAEKRLSGEALRRLIDYSWPGNVRQLEHAIEMAVTLSGTRNTLFLGDINLPPSIPPVGLTPAMPDVELSSASTFEEIIARVERLILDKALQSCGGNKAKAANLLGMKRTTLLYKMKAFDDQTLLPQN